MRFLLILTLIVVSSAVSLTAQCQKQSSSGVDSSARGSGIKIENYGVPTDILQAGMSSWNNCAQGSAIPNFSTSSSGPTVKVHFIEGNSPGRHLGVYDETTKEITFYRRNMDGDILSTNELTTVLRHELGHALGLDDVTGVNCLMYEHLSGDKPVSSTDCSYLNNLWATVCP